MKIVTAFNTISKQITKHGNELKKLEYDINASAANPVYVQLHDFPSAADLAAGRTAPAAGSIPKKSWNSAAGAPNNYKDFTRGEMTFNNGVFVCVSTTEATLTIGTGSNKFDMVSAEVINEEVSGTTEVQSSGDNQAIYSESTGAASVLKLLRMAATNLESGIRYMMLFAIDAPVNGNIPIGQWTMQANGDSAGRDTVYMDFGVGGNGGQANGFTPQQQTAAHVQKRGATMMFSTTPGTLTQSVDVGANMYAEYK